MRGSKARAASTSKVVVAFLSLLVMFSVQAWAQSSASKSTELPAQAEAPKDTLGRNTPRAALLGFLNAARKGNAEVAALYLNTPLRGGDAALLARQLAVVLDRRLPARLNQISDIAEGSVPDPLRPDEDRVGTISTAKGPLDIIVERIDRGKAGKVWLFSRKTLDAIPDVFQELSPPGVEEYLPAFMVNGRLFGVPVFEWLALFIGLPLLFLLTAVSNRLLGWGVGKLLHRMGRRAALNDPQVLPAPVRLLLVAGAIRLLVSGVALPLLARQFWNTTAMLIALVACVWWLLLLTGVAERYLVRRRASLSGSASVLRLVRRLIDGVLLFAGLLFILYHFGINVTAALAGLGVGGIAVALAAQKTLENVIGGVSLIADQALRVGDFLNLGDIQGTVEEVGLRSTRIRTPDRTLVSLPNGQIATMRLETLSARDKFWFHPIVGLRYETTPAQLHSVLSSLRDFVAQHEKVDPTSLRVRFIRLGSFSLDVEIFAYVLAADWPGFLAIQEELLFGVLDLVHRAGTDVAFPSQTLYVTPENAQAAARLFGNGGKEREGDGAHGPQKVLSGTF